MELRQTLNSAVQFLAVENDGKDSFYVEPQSSFIAVGVIPFITKHLVSSRISILSILHVILLLLSITTFK